MRFDAHDAGRRMRVGRRMAQRTIGATGIAPRVAAAQRERNLTLTRAGHGSTTASGEAAGMARVRASVRVRTRRKRRGPQRSLRRRDSMVMIGAPGYASTHRRYPHGACQLTIFDRTATHRHLTCINQWPTAHS
ncbi:hypothetical protein [Paraburkholderia sp. J63]|uniref:hypothetical protein n=1 Tax=Paraburkholderia sp. J63 TaxID=2805434 RepID=UPI002ABD2835|nr:hypothetical protein [Paraburkholderia sp. J63]